MKDGLAKISFVGDLMCLQEQNEAVLAKYGDYDYSTVFEPVKRLFSDSDLIVGNLETPVCDQQLSDFMISFNSPVAFALAVKESLGVDIVSTANNHCLDRGVEGLDGTLDNLDKIGLKHTGTYRTQQESDNILVQDVDGLKVAFVSFTYGTNSKVNGHLLPSDELWRVDLLKKQEKKGKVQWKPEYGPIISKYLTDSVSPLAVGNAMHAPYLDSVDRKISRAKEMADVVVLIPHVGGQYNPAPAAYTRNIFNHFAQSDADVIIGGHPHVPHKYEWINGKFCAFSLGNFSFTPGVGYYLPNTLAEFGIVIHLYLDIAAKQIHHIEYSLVYNHVDADGISRVYPIADYYSSISNIIEKDSFAMEVEAVVNRVSGNNTATEIKDIYSIC